MPHVVSIMVKKGGVSKTTTAINLAAALSTQGKKVLLIDLDSQANATERVFQREAPEGQSAGDGIERLDLHQNHRVYVVQTGWQNLDLLPANASHTVIEKRMPESGESLLGLRYFIQMQGGKWDWIVIDCPNNFHSLTLNAFVASQGIIIPVDLDDEGSIGAIPAVVKTANLVKESMNGQLEIWGILLTKHGPQTSLVQTSLENIRSDPYLKNLLFKTRIRKSQHIKNANAMRIPAVLKFRKNEHVQQYVQLAKEVMSHADKSAEAAQGRQSTAAG